VRRNTGFTLIELLIVVAIIAILAAIAVPNFLEAQTRAKVSRAKADLRSLSTAIEAYYVDWNMAPLVSGTAVGWSGIDGSIVITYEGSTNLSGTLTWVISTPVAYITNAYILDPFTNNDSSIPGDERLFTYHVYLYQAFAGENSGETMDHFINGYGAYRQCSIGPDRHYFHTPTPSPFINYDPTNGTISQGNIWRSQKHGFDNDANFEDPTFNG
jgi:prepilin-type N-terminal cleavage/methylation domain-containing protein